MECLLTCALHLLHRLEKTGRWGQIEFGDRVKGQRTIKLNGMDVGTCKNAHEGMAHLETEF